MAEQQQKLRKKTEKGNPLSRQPFLVRKCTEVTDMCCHNSDRSMYCVTSFSRGLLKSNQECLAHFADTVTSNLEFIPAAFRILNSVKCTGANKIRFNFILSEITRKIMDTLNLNMQLMHLQIGNKPKAKEIKNEDCLEIIEILDDEDDVKDVTIDSLKEINEWQNSAGDQVTSDRFRSNIVADKVFASVRGNLPSIDSGCDTVNTPNSNQVDGVAIIDEENLQTNLAVSEKSTDKLSFIDKRDDADTLILSGIPSCQIKSEIVNLTETPDTQEVKLNIFTPGDARQFPEDPTSEDVVSKTDARQFPEDPTSEDVVSKTDARQFPEDPTSEDVVSKTDARQSPEDPTSEDVISDSEKSVCIFESAKKSRNFRKMPHLKPVIEIDPDKPPNSDLKLAPKGNPGPDEINLNSAAKESPGLDKIKIHSISKLNVNQTLKRKIQYPYKAKKKPNIDKNPSPHINIKANSNKNKVMIVKENLNSIYKANVESNKKASPKSVIFDSRKKSKSFRKMPHLEPVIEISPDKATNTDLKLAPKANPGSDEVRSNSSAKESLGLDKIKIHSISKNVNQTLKRKIYYPCKAKKKPNIDVNQSIKYTNKNKDVIVKENLNLISKANVGSTKKASPKSVINKNQQPSSEGQQPDYRIKLMPLPEESNPESHKRVKMQSTSKASKKSANLESTKMRSVSKTAVKSVINKKLKQSTEGDPQLDYRSDSKPLSKKNNLESNKGAKAAEKLANLKSTKMKSVSKTEVKLVVNKKLKPSTEEDPNPDYRANSKPLSERNESNKAATSKAAMNLVINKNLKPSTEESRQLDDRANSKTLSKRNNLKPSLEESRQSYERVNLKSHSEGNDIELVQNTDIQSICEAVMTSLKNKKLNSKKNPETNIQPHFNVYIVPRHGSITTKLSSSAEEVWGSHNEEDQVQRPETTTKTNLGTRTKESPGRNAETIPKYKTKTFKNSESLIKKEHGNLSRETNFVTTLIRNGSSNDFDYDRNLLVVSRVSPYRDIIRKPRGRQRGRGRGRGKSVTARNEVKGEQNALIERCRGGSVRKPLGRQKGSGRGKVRGEFSTLLEFEGIK